MRLVNAETIVEADSGNNMKQLPVDARNQDILQWVRAWVDLLAEERYEAACNALYRPPGDQATPEMIERAIRHYGSATEEGQEDRAVYKVTPIETTAPPNHPLNQDQEGVLRWGGGEAAIPTAVGVVHFDLPLNGEWSGLTAILSIHEIDASLIFSLDDLRVL